RDASAACGRGGAQRAATARLRPGGDPGALPDVRAGCQPVPRPPGGIRRLRPEGRRGGARRTRVRCPLLPASPRDRRRRARSRVYGTSPGVLRAASLGSPCRSAQPIGDFPPWTTSNLPPALLCLVYVWRV